MNVYVALFDLVAGRSEIIGVFSSEDGPAGSQAACQAHWQERVPGIAGTLTWHGDSALAIDGTYWSRMVTLDERTSA